MPRKGADLEREVCKLLSEWWTNGQDDAVFWRTSQSGGRATSRRKKGRETFGQHGDIAAVNPIGLPFLRAFAVEVKRGYTEKLDLLACFDRKEGSAAPLAVKWIEQARKSKEASGADSFLIIFRRDRRNTMVLVEGHASTFSYLALRNQFTVRVGLHQSLSLMTMEEFLQVFRPGEIRRKFKK